MGKAKLTFLGTGTSQGVPIIGCHCPVCRSADPHDKRLRSAALVEYGGLTILVDAGPDFRIQMLREDVCHIDAILLTHNHMDHTGGLDDVRALNYIDRKAVHIYCEPKVLETLKIMFGYAFAEHKYPGSPEWRIHLIDDSPFAVMPVEGGDLVWMHEKGYCMQMPDGSVIPCGNDIVNDAKKPTEEVLAAGGVKIIPIRGYHDKMPVLGFRFGDIAYITDMSSIPESEFGKLRGLKHLTLNTVSYHPHHSHFSLSEAVALAQRIGAEHTWLTHLSHTFPSHSQFDSELPPGISPAYDGLVISD
ncbi:MAG: MBL fold metallo-hydrolase [Bacteroidales bacterium]|nr:MBL fold metallo-hydrolase [Bacteroidales bacterium]MBQ6291513.1 MBL fold metallo-hydrolase [Bacteroidales bacterium]MBR4480221.1 MBL fold metallo-hydrolase [Bacteroidales bacterium]